VGRRSLCLVANWNACSWLAEQLATQHLSIPTVLHPEGVHPSTADHPRHLNSKRPSARLYNLVILLPSFLFIFLSLLSSLHIHKEQTTLLTYTQPLSHVIPLSAQRASSLTGHTPKVTTATTGE